MAITKIFFGDLEQDVMNAVWDHQPVTVRDVLAVVSRRRTVAYTTVMTIMTRLVRQGFLRRNRIPSGAFQYQAVRSREGQSARATRASVDELVRRYGDVALVQFMETLDDIPADRLQQLKRHLRHRGRS